MRFNQEFLLRYMTVAPLALAFERSLECRILSSMPFERPILDVGCGEGLFASMLFAEKVDTGIDPNPREVARAREWGAYKELLICTGDSVEKPDGHYRTIFSNSVVEHIPELEPVLRETHRLLAPGGRLYLTVPSDRFEEYTIINHAISMLGMMGLALRFRAFYNRFWKHYHCYSLREWEAVAQRAGFRVLASRTYAPKSVCMLNDLLSPLGLTALLTKRALNRWTLFPGLRKILLYPVYLIVRKILNGAEQTANGGLVFLALGKN